MALALRQLNPIHNFFFFFFFFFSVFFIFCLCLILVFLTTSTHLLGHRHFILHQTFWKCASQYYLSYLISWQILPLMLNEFRWMDLTLVPLKSSQNLKILILIYLLISLFEGGGMLIDLLWFNWL